MPSPFFIGDSMTLSEVIAFADGIKPNGYANKTKTHWINEAEGKVQKEILLVREVSTYVWPDDANTVLLARPPHDKLYITYLTAMIDFANGEYEKYQNSMTLFDAQFREFMRWYARFYHPAGYGRREEYDNR